jgi:hypothetical protein
MNDANGYVFERLKAYLPLPACELVLREIDTPKDLEKAKAFVKTFNEHRS